MPIEQFLQCHECGSKYPNTKGSKYAHFKTSKHRYNSKIMDVLVDVCAIQEKHDDGLYKEIVDVVDDVKLLSIKLDRILCSLE